MMINRWSTLILLALFFGTLAINPRVGEASAKHSAQVIQSFFTQISLDSCQKHIDKEDPNDTPVHKCKGVGGYELVWRQVGSGKQSIDVVTPDKKAYSLRIDEVKEFAGSMFHIDSKAQWRVLTSDGKKRPMALIIRVQVHGDSDNPDRVTRSVFVVAKVADKEICVTDTLVASTEPKELHKVADAAPKKKCLL